MTVYQLKECFIFTQLLTWLAPASHRRLPPGAAAARVGLLTPGGDNDDIDGDDDIDCDDEINGDVIDDFMALPIKLVC